MDTTEILKILPHRYPFLLVDRVIEYTPNEKLVGYKNVTANEPFFMGHFPGHPVMPGVLILEALAQACALLAFKSLQLDPSKLVIYLMAIDGAKFRKPVIPGDRIQLTATVVKQKGQIWKQRGEATVDGQLVAEGEFLATVVERDKPVSRVHATAVVHPEASLDSTVEVGPYAVIGPKVRIGAGTRIGPHAVIEGDTTIGAKNRIFQFASVGAEPQDLKYAGEDTKLVIGDENLVREFTTLHKGTNGGGGVTRIGNKNLFMAYSHVAHDCVVGNGCVLANSATLAGHVELGDNVIMGGLTAVHQFSRIGRNAFIAGGAMVVMDIPPYCTAQGDRAELMGLNTVGLTRHGFTDEQVGRIKDAYKILFRSQLGLAEALLKLKAEHGGHSEIDHLIEFLNGSKRGVTR